MLGGVVGDGGVLLNATPPLLLLWNCVLSLASFMKFAQVHGSALKALLIATSVLVSRISSV